MKDTFEWLLLFFNAQQTDGVNLNRDRDYLIFRGKQKKLAT